MTIDEAPPHRVQAKVAGWVESLAVSFEGRPVRRGEPMLALYSPELLATQEEYLLARQHAERLLASSVPEVRRGAEELVSAARRRLALFDVPESFLAALDASGRARRTVELLAPASGHVISREVVAGARIEPGMPLFTLPLLAGWWRRTSRVGGALRAPRAGPSSGCPYDRRRPSRPGRLVYPELDSRVAHRAGALRPREPGAPPQPGMFVESKLRSTSARACGRRLGVIDSRRARGLRAAGAGASSPPVRVLWRGEGRPGRARRGARGGGWPRGPTSSSTRVAPAAALAALGGGGAASHRPRRRLIGRSSSLRAQRLLVLLATAAALAAPSPPSA